MVILYEILKMITFPGALLKGFLEHMSDTGARETQTAGDG